HLSVDEGLRRSLFVTSAAAGEGKSTTALSLARNFAELGLSVLLIDADLRRPRLHVLLGTSSEVGLTNCLLDNPVPHQAFQTTAIRGLMFMAAGRLPEDPSGVLAGPMLRTLIDVASEGYDMVIVDGPATSAALDARLLSSVTTGTLLVVDGSRT